MSVEDSAGDEPSASELKHRLENDDCDNCGGIPFVLYNDGTLLCGQCFDDEDRS